MWERLHVKYPSFLQNFNETWIFSTDFRKNSDIKFHQNPSSGNRVVPCGQTEGRTDMMKLIIAFHNFAKAPTDPGELTQGPVFVILCVFFNYPTSSRRAALAGQKWRRRVGSAQGSQHRGLASLFWHEFGRSFLRISPATPTVVTKAFRSLP